MVINEMIDGGADYCFECVGLSSLVIEAYGCCRKGWGKVVVLGVDKPGSELNFSSFEVFHHDKTITGKLFGGLKPKYDIPILVKRYMDKELQLDEFVTHEVKCKVESRFSAFNGHWLWWQHGGDERDCLVAARFGGWWDHGQN
ncbi:hypothetical protein LguiA_003593 [Lonicera macranthoides]